MVPAPRRRRPSAAAGDLHRYPATDHTGLRAAIGQVHGLDPDRIICGVGSDEVLQFVVQAFAGPGDEVITTEHGFSMYPILARMVGAIPVTVPEDTRRVDVDAILAAVTERTRVVFIANPANPTGTMLGADELQQPGGWPAAAGCCSSMTAPIRNSPRASTGVRRWWIATRMSS